ncbi:MAG: RluA family pseudouridine synthase [Pirellula sp.]|jgi:RluA family pseudouridine synthase|nr:RluA family pseudouridine synthase [Pirellula sp.]
MEILFEHPWFLVVNKPTDLLTQAVAGVDSLQTELVRYLKERTPGGSNPFIGIPHRLDRVTTGVMVVARNQRALRRLSEQFAARVVSKSYHAIVPDGTLLEELSLSQSTVRWIDHLRKIPEEARGEICSAEIEGAKEAIMTVKPCQQAWFSGLGECFRLCEVQLETGRMHQIRLQFASRGMPILGDQLYGSQVAWMDGDFRNAPIALHARRLQFRHPQTAEQMSFEAPYPESWNRLRFEGS